MKINNFPHNLVEKYVKVIKRDWIAPLAKHGYVELGEDLTDDGKWHGELRPLGKVAFWRVGKKGLDGIVVRHIKFLNPEGFTMHATAVNSINEAQQYFKDLGFEEFDLKEAIIVNNKQYDSIRYDSMDFYDFLKSKTSILS